MSARPGQSHEKKVPIDADAVGALREELNTSIVELRNTVAFEHRKELVEHIRRLIRVLGDDAVVPPEVVPDLGPIGRRRAQIEYEASAVS